MIRMLKYIVFLCYTTFFSLLLYYGLDTNYDFLISIVFFAVVILIFMTSREDLTKTNEFRSPLLLNICFLLSNLLLINYPHLWILTSVISISAISDIVIWYLEKSYVGKRIVTILKEELRFPPATGITLIVGLWGYALDNDLIRHPIIWIITIVLVVDVIRQLLCIKQYPHSKDW